MQERVQNGSRHLTLAGPSLPRTGPFPVSRPESHFSVQDRSRPRLILAYFEAPSSKVVNSQQFLRDSGFGPCYRGAAIFVGHASAAGRTVRPCCTRPDHATGTLFMLLTCVFGGDRVHLWDDVFTSANRKAETENFSFFRILR